MHLILLSRSYVLPSLGAKQRTARVSLLQHTDTGRTVWEVEVIARTTRGIVKGAIARKPTRTAAMRVVRQMLYPR